MKKFLLTIIISIFLPGCWVILEPVPTRYTTVVVEEPVPVVTVVGGYPVCEYIEDPYPYEEVHTAPTIHVSGSFIMLPTGVKRNGITAMIVGGN